MTFLRLICLLLLFRSFAAYAQTEVKGLLIDSAHRTLLQSATISVYERGDSKVNKVALSDRFGKFSIKDLPPNKPLRAEFTFQGFEKVVRVFQLQVKENKNLGTINMSMRTDDLEVVEVLAPVRMNGDTIEFNADAFALDTNAVIEDLLHKLPGMVVWGDGLITYNGKEIPSVLVNGKPFFGNDKGIALQNIAKDAVNKMQLYDTRPDEEIIMEPDNPVYEMNVVLKEGREQLFFGNLTAAGGTTERYEGNMNLNLANRRVQSTVAYSTNNTNKYLNSVDQLLKNTTFKGVGVNADFDSDFLRSGLLKQQVLGGRFQYDFEGTGDVNRLNLVTGDIVTRWDRNLLRDSSFTQLASRNDFEINTRSNISRSDQVLRSQRGNFQYQLTKKRNHRDWSWSSHLAVNHEKRDSESAVNRLFDYPDKQSRLESFRSSGHANKGMKFTTALSIRENTSYESVNSFLEQLSYDFEISSEMHQDHSDSRIVSVFQDLLNEGVNRNANREYDRLHDEGRHLLAATIKYKSFEISNQLYRYHSGTDSKAADIGSEGYVLNEALTHESSFSQLKYSPSLRYGLLLYNRNLVGRRSERLHLRGEFGYRLQQEANESTYAYLTLKRRYTTPLPKAALTYNYSLAGRFIADATLAYSLDKTYPTLQQLRPLYDDIDPSYRYFGGSDLRETGLQSVTANFDFRELKAYGMSWHVRADYRRNQNGLSDSIRYAEGQQHVYTVNIEQPMHSFYAQADIRQAFLLPGDRGLNVSLRASHERSNRFQYIDGREQSVQTNNKSASLDAHYTRDNTIQVAWRNHWNHHNRTSPGSSTNSYSSTEWRSGLSISYQVLPKWNIASNATARISKSTFFKDEALIWNAGSTYRLLKGNNLHLKFSAYDLLRQFKGIYQSHDFTEFTTGYRNNLNQYFMLSVSYFPRKFGR